MKNAKQLLAALTVLLVITAGCGSKPQTANVDELDLAIRDTSDYLNDNVPKGNKIVILNVQSDFPALSDYIIDELIANAVNDRIFSVVDRQQLDLIRQEQNFQWSGEVSDKSAQEIGQLLGAQTIVSGAVSPLGDRYRLRVRALEVQTAQVQGQYNRNMAVSRTLNDLMKSGGGTRTAAASTGNRPASGTAQASSQAQPATPAPAAVKTYKVGDTGPAGGIIFYDKGNSNGGWRYLEAAPVDVEFQAKWSVKDTYVGNTRLEIGSGKRNTQLIVEKFSQTSGEWDTAAQKCDDLVYGGFDDWFLPSSDELNQMYGNLKRKNLGDFKNDWYWSASFNYGNAVSSLWKHNFSDGGTGTTFAKWENNLVRPIRQF